MKERILMLLVAITLTFSVFAEYYYYQGEKVMIKSIDGKQSKIKLLVNEPTMDTTFNLGQGILYRQYSNWKYRD